MGDTHMLVETEAAAAVVEVSGEEIWRKPTPCEAIRIIYSDAKTRRAAAVFLIVLLVAMVWIAPCVACIELTGSLDICMPGVCLLPLEVGALVVMAVLCAAECRKVFVYWRETVQQRLAEEDARVDLTRNIASAEEEM